MCGGGRGGGGGGWHNGIMIMELSKFKDEKVHF